MAAMDEKLDRLFTETRALREEMRAGFSELRGEISELRRDLSAFQRHGTSSSPPLPSACSAC
jgi:hypothetical protein